MKKGQLVRILRTGEIRRVAGIELIRKGGEVHRYCRLAADEGRKPDLWMDASELGGMKERCTLISRNEENGQELCLAVTRDYRDGRLDVTLTGRNPENMKVHGGYM